MLNFSENNDFKICPYSEKLCLECGEMLHPFQIPSVLGLPPKWLPASDYCQDCQEQREQKERGLEEQKRIQEAFRNAMLSPRFQNRTFENFQVTDQNRKALEIAQGFEVNPQGNGLLFFGPYGTGKTHLAVAIVNRCVGKVSVLYISCPDLLNEIRESIQGRGSLHRFDLAKMVKLLVIDDIGAEKPSEWVRETLFVLINYRYEHQLCTIFTTNCRLDELERRLGGRIVSRIAEMCRCVRLTGKDRRLSTIDKQIAQE